MNTAFGLIDLSDALRPKQQGVPVNSHVIPNVKEPTPDYDAMSRLVSDSAVMQLSMDDVLKQLKFHK